MPWLDQATRLEPRHGGVAIARGDLALARGDPEAAREHYRRAIDVDPFRATGTARARLDKMPGGGREELEVTE